MAVDVAGLVGSQEQRNLCDLLRLAAAPERRRRVRPSAPEGGPSSEDLTERIVDLLADRSDGAGAESVARELDADPERVAEELGELVALGLVTRSDDGGIRYWLG